MVYQSKAYNFVLRLVAACVLAPLVLFVTSIGGEAFTAMVIAGAIIMGGEWSQMTYHKNNLWKLAGIPYILIPCLSLLWIIELEPDDFSAMQINGTSTVISIFVLVWANDIGGYIFGKLIGAPKLAPKISPNKTWAGFVGGIICAMAIAPLLSEKLVIAAIVAMIASAGDLLESWMKRRCKVKDSGSIIPGHGGLLDRVDGILLVATIIAVIGFGLEQWS